MKLTSTNKEKLQKAWVLRLLNEETPQNVSGLCDMSHTAFCCLGDALEVAISLGIGDVVYAPYDNSYEYKEDLSDIHMVGNSEYLPQDFASDWLNWNHADYGFNYDRGNFSATFGGYLLEFNLASMNDAGVPKRILGVLAFAFFTPDLSLSLLSLKSEIINQVVETFRQNEANLSTTKYFYLEKMINKSDYVNRVKGVLNEN